MVESREPAPRTPGPWTVSERDDVDEEMNIGFGICGPSDDDWVVIPCCSAGIFKEADARLIAAAPELIQALREIRAALEDLRKHSCAGFDCSYCNPSYLRDLADSVIFKAEGGTVRS